MGSTDPPVDVHHENAEAVPKQELSQTQPLQPDEHTPGPNLDFSNLTPITNPTPPAPATPPTLLPPAEIRERSESPEGSTIEVRPRSPPKLLPPADIRERFESPEGSTIEVRPRAELLGHPKFPTLAAASTSGAAERNKAALDLFLFESVMQLRDEIFSHLTDAVNRQFFILVHQDQVRRVFSERLYGKKTPKWENELLRPPSVPSSEASSRRSPTDELEVGGDARRVGALMTAVERLRNLNEDGWRELEREYATERDRQWTRLTEKVNKGTGGGWSVEEVKRRWEEC